MVLDENESLFLPAASIGFDSTTKRRLRIPREIIDQHSALEREGTLSLTGDDRIIFEPFFSVREFGLFTQVDALGIRHDGTTYAVILIASNEDEKAMLPLESLPLGSEYSTKLFTSYSAKLKGLLPPPYFADIDQAYRSLEPTVSRYHEAGRSIHVYSVDFKSLIEAVKPASPTIDLFRFSEDLLRMLYSLISATGIFCVKGEDEVILGFATTTAKDGEFLARHLKLSIGDFFPHIGLPDTVIRYRKSIHPDEAFNDPSLLFD